MCNVYVRCWGQFIESGALVCYLICCFTTYYSGVCFHFLYCYFVSGPIFHFIIAEMNSLLSDDIGLYIYYAC